MARGMVPTGVGERENDSEDPATAPLAGAGAACFCQDAAIALFWGCHGRGEPECHTHTHTRCSDGNGGGGAGGGGGAQERRGRGRRGRKSSSDVPLDKRERIKKRVKGSLMKMRTGRNLLEAYSRDGSKGQSREKTTLEQEAKRAEAQILCSKLAIREAIHELDDMGLKEKIWNAEAAMSLQSLTSSRDRS